MKSITLAAFAFLATTPFVFADTTTTATASTGIEQPSAAPTLNAPSVHGCYSDSGELVFNSTQTFNSEGKCATEICYAGGFTVAGTTGGSDCWCGNKYPASSLLTNDTECNIGCTGYPQQACGGLSTFTIYNTGVKLAVEESKDTTSSSSSSSSGVVAATTSTNAAGGTTIIYTATAAAATSSSASSSDKGGTNTVGIAVGVVVAIVAVAGVAGAIFFVMRRRRNRELEEEHRRNAAVNAFMNGGKPPSSSGGMSMADTRLDPVMVQRRMSDGSIADNQDYSRRILRVTNA